MKKKFLSLALAATMVLSMAACGDKNDSDSSGTSNSASADNTDESAASSGDESAPPSEEGPTDEGPQTYIYKDHAGVMPTNWNRFTYKTTDDSYPIDYIADSLYTMMYNDEAHPKDGAEPYKSYVWVPAMAADFPTDVTAQVKAEHPEFNIPESAENGYAWSVKLRDDLKWDDGTPITTDTFLKSYELLLRPELINYRASDAYEGSFTIVNSRQYSLSGQPVFQSFEDQGTTFKDFLADGHTEDEVYINMRSLWNVVAPDGHDQAIITDDTMVRDPAVDEGADEDYVSAKYLYDNYLADEMPYAGFQDTYLGTVYVPYEEGYSFDNVGIFVSGENELTFVYENAVSGFNLYANIGVPLVKPDLYESLLVENESSAGSVWSTTYCTNKETSPSYGPYIISDYQLDKSMHFVKNPNWYGWNYDAFKYVDPVDGQTYDPYMTDEIDLQYVKEAATVKTMFLAGQVMTYGLQAEDFDQYRNSEYTLATPGQAVYMLLLNGYSRVLDTRENAADFDKTTTDIQTMQLPSFRAATAVSIDRDDMAATISPARSAGYGLIGTRYVVDTELGTLYRDTDAAKKALCSYYSVDIDAFNGDLDAAVDSITGFDPDKAKELYTQAFQDALDAGYITDEDGDGISDQTVVITYAASDVTDFMNKTIDYLNTSFARATEGTPFDGKILFQLSAPVGNAWSDRIEDGTYDTALAGWNGNDFDPYNFALVWTGGPGEVYWGNWFDASTIDATFEIDGEEITMNLRQWAECLNGTMTTVNGKDYNFGEGQTTPENRLQILANIEEQMLKSGNCAPIMADGGMSMHSQQIYYVVDEYSPFLRRGGLWYLKYNYNESEWNEYVKSQGGTLKY